MRPSAGVTVEAVPPCLACGIVLLVVLCLGQPAGPGGGQGAAQHAPPYPDWCSYSPEGIAFSSSNNQRVCSQRACLLVLHPYSASGHVCGSPPQVEQPPKDPYVVVALVEPLQSSPISDAPSQAALSHTWLRRSGRSCCAESVIPLCASLVN